MSDRNNVLLVILDSVRARNTSLHGYGRQTTPFLDSFAEQSTVYSQARAPGIHSIASHVSMFTGAHVEEHRALRHTAEIDLTETIWHELASEYNYRTGLFTNNRIVSHASNLGDGFDHLHVPSYPLSERLENAIDGTMLEQAYFRGYDGLSRASQLANDLAPTAGPIRAVGSSVATGVGTLASVASRFGANGDDPGGGYKTLHGSIFTDAFIDWQAEQDGPWAACINLMDPHSPYEPAAEYDNWSTEEAWEIQRSNKPSIWETLQGRGWDRIEALEGLYDGAIRQSDQIIAGLVSDMKEAGILDETLLVVTSDHGEAFGEQSRLDPDIRLRDHKWGIHEILTHVPLVVKYPDQEQGRVESDIVSLTDTPALLRTAVLQSEVGDDGDDPLLDRDEVLASTFRLPEEKVSKYGSIEDIDRYVGPWRAVYEPSDGDVRKYAQRGTAHVTVDIGSPGSATVVSREPQDRVATAYDHLADGDILTRASTEIDERLEDQLEDLGYIR